ncbi:immunoglobulin-like domain-containing protein [Tannockella kyphosi]|uniref:immunoglobulin-like domain-containing protein n=1 Tax=Tannockella kyphosi TaxID=2899121 RepID=UPI002010FC30|nr:immunoglobulin-like domain-containing protein [Tannockella kyphosi]
MKNKIIMCISTFFIVCSCSLLLLTTNIEEIQLKKDTFVYEYGKSEISTNIGDYIIASDQVKEDAELNLSAVMNEVGTYNCTIIYLGKEYPFTIQVIDTTNPTASLLSVQVNVATGATLIASDLVVVSDESMDYTVYFLEGQEYIESKTYLEEGTYIESIVVRDASNNSSTTLRIKINVGDNNNIPSFSGVDTVTIEIGSYFDPLAGVSASDGLGNDITGEIVIIKNDVDTSQAGFYEVIYAVTNSQGNNVQRSRKIVVE